MKNTYGCLKRKLYFGITYKKVKLSTNYPDSKTGFNVINIVKNSPAEKAGLLRNDIITDIANLKIDNFNSITEIMDRITERKIVAKIIRSGSIMTIPVIFEPRPLETCPSFNIEYSCFFLGIYKIRTIVTMPKSCCAGKRTPVILFIQGINCDSIDYPFSDTHPYKKLIYKLTELGFATVRTERYGSGDSEGPDPKDMTFTDELELFNSALIYTFSISNIDINNIYIFGYSTGGIIAPILAAKYTCHVKGIIVFGTFTSKFSEYCIKNVVRQHTLKGSNIDSLKKEIKEFSALLNLLLTEKHTPRYIIESDESYKKYFTDIKYIFGRSYLYAQQLEDVPILDYWEKIDVPAIIVAGKCDYVTDIKELKHLYQLLLKKGRPAILLEPFIDHNFFDINTNDFSYRTVEDICKYLIKL